MTTKPDGHAHGLPGHRAANRPALVVVLGLCLSCALWSLTGFHGARKTSAKPRKISEEALDELAAGLALRGGRWVVRPPAAGWGAAPYWGPTAQASTRGGKYVITAAAEVELERLHVLAASLRRWSPATKLVLFTADTGGSIGVLQAAGEPAVRHYALQQADMLNYCCCAARQCELPRCLERILCTVPCCRRRGAPFPAAQRHSTGHVQVQTSQTAIEQPCMRMHEAVLLPSGLAP